MVGSKFRFKLGATLSASNFLGSLYLSIIAPIPPILRLLPYCAITMDVGIISSLSSHQYRLYHIAI